MEDLAWEDFWDCNPEPDVYLSGEDEGVEMDWDYYIPGDPTSKWDAPDSMPSLDEEDMSGATVSQKSSFESCKTFWSLDSSEEHMGVERKKSSWEQLSLYTRLILTKARQGLYGISYQQKVKVQKTKTADVVDHVGEHVCDPATRNAQKEYRKPDVQCQQSSKDSEQKEASVFTGKQPSTYYKEVLMDTADLSDYHTALASPPSTPTDTSSEYSDHHAIFSESSSMMSNFQPVYIQHLDDDIDFDSEFFSRWNHPEIWVRRYYVIAFPTEHIGDQASQEDVLTPSLHSHNTQMEGSLHIPQPKMRFGLMFTLSDTCLPRHCSSASTRQSQSSIQAAIRSAENSLHHKISVETENIDDQKYVTYLQINSQVAAQDSDSQGRQIFVIQAQDASFLLQNEKQRVDLMEEERAKSADLQPAYPETSEDVREGIECKEVEEKVRIESKTFVDNLLEKVISEHLQQQSRIKGEKDTNHEHDVKYSGQNDNLEQKLTDKSEYNKQLSRDILQKKVITEQQGQRGTEYLQENHIHDQCREFVEYIVKTVVDFVSDNVNKVMKDEKYIDTKSSCGELQVADVGQSFKDVSTEGKAKNKIKILLTESTDGQVDTETMDKIHEVGATLERNEEQVFDAEAKSTSERSDIHCDEVEERREAKLVKEDLHDDKIGKIPEISETNTLKKDVYSADPDFPPERNEANSVKEAVHDDNVGTIPERVKEQVDDKKAGQVFTSLHGGETSRVNEQVLPTEKQKSVDEGLPVPTVDTSEASNMPDFMELLDVWMKKTRSKRGSKESLVPPVDTPEIVTRKTKPFSKLGRKHSIPDQIKLQEDFVSDQSKILKKEDADVPPLSDYKQDIPTTNVQEGLKNDFPKTEKSLIKKENEAVVVCSVATEKKQSFTFMDISLVHSDETLADTGTSLCMDRTLGYDSGYATGVVDCRDTESGTTLIQESFTSTCTLELQQSQTTVISDNVAGPLALTHETLCFSGTVFADNCQPVQMGVVRKDSCEVISSLTGRAEDNCDSEVVKSLTGHL